MASAEIVIDSGIAVSVNKILKPRFWSSQRPSSIKATSGRAIIKPRLAHSRATNQPFISLLFLAITIQLCHQRAKSQEMEFWRQIYNWA